MMAANSADLFALPAGLAGQRVGEADHGVERRAELVAHGGEEARLRLVRRLRLRLGPLQLALGDARIGDVGGRGDEAAAGGRIGTDLEHPARGRDALGAMGPGAVLLEHLARPHPGLRVGAELAAFEDRGDDLPLRAARHQQLGRVAEQLGRDPVARHHPPRAIPEHDAVADMGEHRVHHRDALRQLLLRLRQGGDVGDHADMAAAGQRRGADLDGGAVGLPALAVLGAGAVHRHPGADDLLHRAGTIAARLPRDAGSGPRAGRPP